MPSRSVSILGCGWLGFPLAKRFLSLHFDVKGSTTTSDKLPLLKENRIAPFLVHCSPNSILGDMQGLLQSDGLFVNIPFLRDFKNPQDYFQIIQKIVSYVQDSPVSFVVFASSTSVYPDELQLASENDVLKPHNERAQVLLKVEDLFMGNKKFKSTVIRFAGLFGGERGLKSGFLEKESLLNPQGLLNLIHLDDCIEIVAQVFTRNLHGEILNACCDGHPSREDFYRHLAQAQGLPLPQFEGSGRSVYKIVSNEKLKDRLNYKFQHPTPLAF